jgi:transposase
MKSGLSDHAEYPSEARRRRFWSSDEKRRMIAESFAPGASVSKVAQRYGVNANLLFTWRRRDARSAASGGTQPLELVPVRVADERSPAAPVAAPGPIGRMEIVLAAGERILVGADVDAAALARVVKALSRR